MKQTHNPDNRRNNEERIKTKMNKTMHNAETADEIITKTTDNALKEKLTDKNSRRKTAMNHMREKVKELEEED